MPSTTDYAQLALRTYLDDNATRISVPANWTEVVYRRGSMGFGGGIYLNNNTNEVVISYTGTEGALDIDWVTNFSFGVGLAFTTQLRQAIELYQEAKTQFAGSSISFTGHSLGGGLASMMAVFFNKTATNFAEAPFEPAVRHLFDPASVPNGLIAARIAAMFALQQTPLYAAARILGTSDLDFNAHFSDATDGVFLQRETGVTNFYVEGEAVSPLRFPLTAIVGADIPMPIGSTAFGPVDRHSMALHLAVHQSALGTASALLPGLLPAMGDSALFPNILPHLLRHQFGLRVQEDSGVVETRAPDFMRDRFASDMLRLGNRSVGGAHSGRAQGLIELALQRYHEFGETALPADFAMFELLSGGLKFDMSQIAGGQLAAIKGYNNRIRALLGIDMSHGLPMAAPALPALSNWYVQVGAADSGRLEATGTAADELLWGGSSADQLAGGGGADVLVGGAGNDIYTYSAGDGADTIYDADRQGQISIGGSFVLTGGVASILSGSWRDDEHGITYRAKGNDLIVSGDGLGTGGSNSITVKSFVNGDLGIELRRTPKIELSEGRDLNGWVELAHQVATDVLSTIKEGFSKTYTIALSAAAVVGEKIRIAVDGATNFLKGIFGDEIVSFENGQVEVTVPEGQNTVTFSIVQSGDIDSDQNVQLSATLLPAPGDTGGTEASHSLTLTLDGREEPEAGDDPATTRNIVGDREPINFGTASDPVYREDDLGNLIVGGAAPNRADHLKDSAGNDFIAPGGGDDWVEAKRGGDDVIEAGSGSDYIEAGDGNDVIDGGSDDDQLMGQAGDDRIKGGQGHDVLRGDIYQTGPQGDDILEGGTEDDIVYGMDGDDLLYGEDEMDLEDAISEGESHPGESGKGDFVEGLDGSDVAIGSHRADVISGGDGDDILVGGGGDDFLLGDLTYDVITGWTFVKNEIDGVIHYGLPGTSFVSEGSGDDLIHAGGGDDDVLANDGDDLVFGEAGADTVFGGLGSDTLLGGEGDDRLVGEEDDDFLDGGDGDDKLFGQDGDDALFGGEGDDRLQGDDFVAGDDYLDGEAGADTLIGVGGADQLFGGEGDDVLAGDSDDTVEEDQGDDEIYGEEGDDKLLGYAGDDYLEGNEGDDRAWGYEGEDTIYGGEGDDQLAGDLATDDEDGDADYLDGEEGDDLLVGDGGDDVLVGGEGNDQLQGGFGDDELYGDEGDDILFGQAGDDYLDGGDGDDIIVGEDATGSADGGNDTIVAGAGDDIILGEAGDDSIDGGEGDDIMLGQAGDDSIDGGEGDDQMDAGEGDDSAGGGEGDDLVFGGEGDDALSGDEGEDVLVGQEGDDALDGGDDRDTLFGGEGNDSITGGAGDDFLQGDEGDDTIDGGEGRDLYGYAAGHGRDTISDSGGNTLRLFGFSGEQVSLRVGSLVLDFGGGDEIHIEGIDLNDPFANPVIDTFVFDDMTLSLEELLSQGFEIVGTPDSDILTGTGGADRIDALESDDVVSSNAGDDEVLAGEGHDMVFAGDGDDEVHGDGGDDVLLGEMGDDVLDGGTGEDRLAGGVGHDTYVIHEAGDQIFEAVDEGTDHVEASIDYTLGDNIEDLVLLGSDNLNGTGNGGDNFIGGNTGSNLLLGLDGDDLLEGGGGSDTLDGGVGNDTLVLTTGGFAAASGVLLGGEGDDHLLGNDADDLLDGGTGIDSMEGGAGNDLYIVDESDDDVYEQDLWHRDVFSGEVTVERMGFDTVESSVSFVLSDFVETLTLTGSDHIDGTGNSEFNTLNGNDGNNVLVSTRLDNQNDNLAFGPGAVAYFGIFPSALDERLWDRALRRYFEGEITSDQLDSIGEQVSVDARDGDYLYGNGGNDRLIGSWDHDVLFGGDGDDLLVGSGGSDNMYGGAGSDSYVIDRDFQYVFGYANTATIFYEDHFTDLLYEEEGEAFDIDTVYSNTFEYGLESNFENLVLLDGPTREALGFTEDDGLFSSNATPTYGYGNELDNTITGNLFDNGLYGNEGADFLYGRDGNDWLDGGEGADVMTGGANDDGYYVDQEGDVVIEETFSGVQEGYDYVLSDITYTLTANVEDLELQGEWDDYFEGYFENLDGTGNELDNGLYGNDGDNILAGLEGNDYLFGSWGDDTLEGGEGNDVLDGYFGVDLMTGGGGDDTYYVDDEFDVTTEDSDTGGIDQVYSSVTHTLGENIENLQLLDRDPDDIPAGNINGTGNELANTIVGNYAENILLGLEGDDQIYGNSGNDFVEAGEGNDFVDGGHDDDVVYGDEGDDILEGGFGHDELHGGDGQDRLDGGFDQDDLFGGAGNDVFIVDWSADAVYEDLDEGLDHVISSDSFTLSENVENLTLLGDYSDNGNVQGYSGIGNDLANVILGNDGFNFLEGWGGNDRIDGRAGNDDIFGDDDNDNLYGGDDAIFIGSGYGGYGGGEEAFAFTLDKQPDTGDDDDDDGGYGGYGGFEVLASNSDWIEGGSGTDQIDGGSGNDRLWGDYAFDGSSGDDDVIYGGDDGLSIDADNGFVDGGEGAESNGRLFLTNDDDLHGGGGNDYLDGESGDDELYGDEGNDTLVGGADGPLNTSNNDYLDGGAGIDSMAGGTQDDHYRVDGTFILTPLDIMSDCGVLQTGVISRVWTYDAVIEHADEGYDFIEAAAEITLADHVERLGMLEFSTAGGGAALQFGGGNALDNEITGNSNGNRLEGGAGTDVIDGRGGDDVLEGGTGDDVLFGGSGNDTYNLTLGTGRDYAYNQGGGFDRVRVTQQVPLSAVTLSTNGVDVVISIDGTGDSLTLANWFTNDFGSPTHPTQRVREIVFCDGTTLTDPQIATLAQQHILVANNDFASVSEDGPPVSGNVLTNDTADGAEVTVLSAGTYFGSYGQLELAADGSYAYTPSAEWLNDGDSRQDVFFYQAQDETGITDDALLRITINGANDAPQVWDADDAGEVTEDFAFVFDFESDRLPNGDFDDGFFAWNLDGDTSFSGVQNEEAYFGAIGAETILSQEVFTSADAQYVIRFEVRGGAASDATFSASWNGEVLTSFENVEFDEYTEFSYFVQGTDDYGRLEFVLRNDPDFWYLDEVEVNELGHVEFIPEFQTDAGFVYFTDDQGDSHDLVVTESGEGYLGGFGVDFFDSSFAVANWNFSVANEDLQYLAEGDTLVQQYHITLTELDDSPNEAATRTVTVTINGTNDAPIANTDEAWVAEDGELVATGNVLLNDEEIDQGDTFSLITTGTFIGQYGTLVLDEFGDYTYTLDNASVQFLAQGDQAADYFDYEIIDHALNPASSTGTVIVYVDGSNDAPVAVNDVATVQEDVELYAFGNVLDNDTDVDQGAVLEIETPGDIDGLYGVLTLAFDGSYTFALDNEHGVVQALAEGATLTEAFLYTAWDGIETDDGLLTVTIVGTNDAPEAADDEASVTEDVQPVAEGNVLANDTDLDSVLTVAEPGSFAGAWGTLALGVDGSYTYTLGNAARVLRTGDTELDVFTYQAFDGFETSEAELVVTIHGNNDGPSAANDLAGVQEDGNLTATGNVLDNDRDPEPDTVLSVTEPGVYAGDYGTLVLDEFGDYTYTLDNDSALVQAMHQGRTVLERFSYEASDGSATDEAVLTVLIAGANDAPVAIDDSASASEDTAVIGGRVLDNDTDIDTDTILRVTTPGTYAGSYGTLTITANGGYRYALNNGMLQSLAQGEEVVDAFAYTASDGFAPDGATLTITVIGANDAPVTVNDAASVQEDVTLTASGNVLLNDTDVDAGAVVTVENFGTLTGTFGTLTLGENGAYTYVLDNGAVQPLRQGQSVTDTFAYLATDGIDSTEGTLTVTVNGTNDAPDALADSAAVSEDDVLSASGNVLANDTDVDTGVTAAVASSGLFGNDTGAITGTTTLTVTAGIFAGAYGTLMLAADGSYSYMLNNAGPAVQGLADGQIVYDVFDYDVSDGLATSTSQLTIEVTGANDAPVTSDDAAAVQEDVTLVATGNVLDNDTDVDFEAELTVDNAGTYGDLTLEADGSFEYELDNDALAVQALAAGQTVTDEFTYVATDGIDSTDGTLTVTITGTNDAPVTVNDAASVQEDVTLTATGNVLGNDTDVDTGTMLLVAMAGDRNGAYGVLHLAANGVYTYELNNAGVQSLAAGQNVTDTFGYAATDGITFTPGELRVNIAGTNDVPVARNDAAAASEDGSTVVSGNVLGNDTDVDAGTTLTVLAPNTFVGTYGTLVLGGTGAYTYTLNNASTAVQALRAGQSVSDTFSYAASDGSTSSPAQLTVNIAGANDRPVAAADANAVQEDGTLSVTGNVLANDTDVDAGTTLNVFAPNTFNGTYGTLILGAGGAYTYTLNNASTAVQSLARDQVVSDVFTYEASDGIERSASSLTVTVTGVNDAPTVVDAIEDQNADAGTLFELNVNGTFGDIDQNDVLAYSAALVNGDPLPTWLTFNVATRTFTGTPPGGGGCDCNCEGGTDNLQIRVFAADLAGATAFDDFNVAIEGGASGGGQHIVGTNNADTLTGTECDDLIEGLKGNDKLHGLAGNDVLDGGKGFDKMYGGAGDDVYYVDKTCEDDHGHHGNEGVGNGEDPPPPGHDHNQNDGHGTSPGNPGSQGGHGHDDDDDDHDHDHDDDCGHDDCKVDEVVETANQGYDIVYASADYTLTANVEELRLTGSSDLDGTGNSLNNVIVGNSGDNELSGGAGMDVIAGGRGDDRLKGGTGGDVYLHDLYGGDDVIEETGSDSDTLLLGEGITAGMVRLKRRNDDLVVDLSGSHGSVTVKGWFGSSSKRVESIQFADGTSWNVQQIRDRVQSSSGNHDDDDHGDHHGGNNHGDDRDHRDRDNDRDHDRDDDRHSSRRDDDWCSGRLSRPARFDFEQLQGLLGRDNRTLSKNEIAARWRAVGSYAQGVGADDDGREGAWLSGTHGNQSSGMTANGGSRFGFEGSVGTSRGQDNLRTLEGLIEGFRRL